MTLRKHTIVGAAKGGLKPNYFLARNPPRASTCPFSKTRVWIAARPQLFKVHAPLIHAMLRDRRSPDLDGTVGTDGSYLPFSNPWTRSAPPKSTDVISFVISDFGIFNSQTLLSSVHQSSGVGDLWTPILLNQ
jgi:hypothetical protein